MKQKPIPRTQQPPAHRGLIDITNATRGILGRTTVRMTPSLWEAVGGVDLLDADDERLRELSWYVLFALAGLTAGGEGEGFDSILVPVAFEHGTFHVRIGAHRDEQGKTNLQVSLPDEPINNVA